MPNFKNTLSADKETDKKLLQIYNELFRKKECTIENASTPEWHGTLIRFGHEAKDLIKTEYIDPIWKTSNAFNKNKRLIRVKPDVDIVKNEGERNVFFRFKKRNLV